VWINRERRRVYKTCATKLEAQRWRRAALASIDAGTLRAPSNETLADTAAAFIAGMRDGTVRSRKGEVYKPSAIRSYERCLRLRILPALGHVRLSHVERRHVQALVDGWLRGGLDPSTIKNTLNPLQAIYRRAVQRDVVAVNPTVGLDLPRSRGRRDRIAPPDEGVRLLAALPSEDQPLWATAMYAGLRRGELRALLWENVDLATGVITVEAGWDDVEGEVEGKTVAARRSVPIPAALRDYLVAHKLRTGGNGLVFGREPSVPFEPSTVRRRALAAWSAAGLSPIGLHEARHTYASLMIAAGVNAKALSTYIGHSSIQITLDLYGHLMPGNEDEAVALVDAYLERSAGHSVTQA
jgi:integrase